MRLTYDKNGTEPKIYDCDFLDNNKCIQKLGQLEDIEEELGIDLLTFVKVLKAPEIYVKRKNEIFEVLHCDIRWDIVVNSIAIVLEESKNHTLYSIYHLRDYGKTWALTKEELL